jgi:repressor of nif and glnA expression
LDITKETRLESFEQISHVADIRKRMILDVLNECGELSAQEIAHELHKRGLIPSDERNFTAPRLTELRNDGKVTQMDKKYCAKTGRKVTVWALV